MGYDLLGNALDCRVSARAWYELLDLGRTHGWKPEGTVPTEYIRSESWSGSYYGNDWQRVTASDAHSLRKALLRAKRAFEIIRDLEESNKSQAERQKDKEDEFRRDEKLAMIGLCDRVIKFLAGGSFTIS
jgi:hypothetical protein